MLACWYDEQGPAAEVLQLGELPDPAPGPGEVRVRVSVSGANPPRPGLCGGGGDRHAVRAAQLGQQVLQVAHLFDVVDDPGPRHLVGEAGG